MSAALDLPAAIAAPQRAPFIARAARLVGPPILALGGVLLVWHIMSLVFPRTLFPGIAETFAMLPELMREPGFQRDVWLTSLRTLAGFGAALVLGTAAGLAMGYSGLAQTMIRPVIVVLQTVSAVIWCFFAVIWFGLSNLSVTFVVFVAGFPIMAFAVWEGVKAMDLELEAMARAFNVPRRMILREITLPAICSHLFGGIRGCFSYCWRTAILAELVIGQHGLGYSMYFAWQNFRTTEVFAWVVVTVGLMLVSEYLFIRPIEAWVMRWRPRRAGA